jgi:hypothetical protein
MPSIKKLFNQMPTFKMFFLSPAFRIIMCILLTLLFLFYAYDFLHYKFINLEYIIQNKYIKQIIDFASEYITISILALLYVLLLSKYYLYNLIIVPVITSMCIFIYYYNIDIHFRMDMLLNISISLFMAMYITTLTMILIYLRRFIKDKYKKSV